MSADAIVLHSGVTSETVVANVLPFSARFASALGVDINVTAFTAGTSPSITFFVERLGADNVWFPIWSPAAIAATGKTSANISPYNPTAAQNGILAPDMRVRYVFTGSVAPTGVNFSVTVYPQP